MSRIASTSELQLTRFPAFHSTSLCPFLRRSLNRRKQRRSMLQEISASRNLYESEQNTDLVILHISHEIRCYAELLFHEQDKTWNWHCATAEAGLRNFFSPSCLYGEKLIDSSLKLQISRLATVNEKLLRVYSGGVVVCFCNYVAIIQISRDSGNWYWFWTLTTEEFKNREAIPN